MCISFRLLVMLLASWMAGTQNSPALGQTSGQEQPAPQTRESMALTFPEGKTVTLKLEATTRLPKAKGEAKVQRKKGATEIEVEVDEMRPAILFGGDFNTYVLWTVSPEGYVANVGEFVLEGNRSKLNVTSRLETFGLAITAEPHFLVRSPSRFVVMESSRLKSNLDASIQTSQIRYQGYEGVYKFQREALDPKLEAKGEMRTDLNQAQKAVELAERVQAEKYAVAKLAEARMALRKTEEAVRGKRDKKLITALGKEAVRLGYDAQTQAEAARQEEMRQASEAEKVRLTAEREAAARQAEESAQRAAADQEARRRAEEERQTAEKRRAEAELQAARDGKAKAEAEAARLTALANEQQAKAEADRSREAAERSEREKQELRARLLEQFNRILETRDTPRGLVVTMADVLFDTGKYDLRPAARERLAKLSGIVLGHPGLKLEIEGHTDSTGSDELNQRLSEQRADAVRQYLVGEHLDPSSLTAKGYGKSMPIADNQTAAGRQTNRRVEMIVSGEVIGTQIGTK
jgi:outer membrane protein OmpA-like peptidoglycan-associated protein